VPASSDSIRIAELELRAQIGVPAAERATSQRLTASLVLWPVSGFAKLHDELAHTIDYSAVCKTVKAVVAARPRRLLETLAADIADDILRAYPACRAVDVELRKYVLPDTAHVAVCLRRQRPAAR
jgi:dihydroneopterin aldolase